MALDLDRPRIGGHRAGIAGRLILADAEFVEIVIAGDGRIGGLGIGDGVVGLAIAQRAGCRAGAGRCRGLDRGRSARLGLAASQTGQRQSATGGNDAAAVEVETFRGDIGLAALPGAVLANEHGSVSVPAFD